MYLCFYKGPKCSSPSLSPWPPPVPTPLHISVASSSRCTPPYSVTPSKPYTPPFVTLLATTSLPMRVTLSGPYTLLYLVNPPPVTTPLPISVTTSKPHTPFQSCPHPSFSSPNLLTLSLDVVPLPPGPQALGSLSNFLSLLLSLKSRKIVSICPKVSKVTRLQFWFDNAT